MRRKKIDDDNTAKVSASGKTRNRVLRSNEITKTEDVDDDTKNSDDEDCSKTTAKYPARELRSPERRRVSSSRSRSPRAHKASPCHARKVNEDTADCKISASAKKSKTSRKRKSVESDDEPNQQENDSKTVTKKKKKGNIDVNDISTGSKTKPKRAYSKRTKVISQDETLDKVHKSENTVTVVGSLDLQCYDTPLLNDSDKETVCCSKKHSLQETSKRASKKSKQSDSVTAEKSKSSAKKESQNKRKPRAKKQSVSVVDGIEFIETFDDEHSTIDCKESENLTDESHSVALFNNDSADNEISQDNAEPTPNKQLKQRKKRSKSGENNEKQTLICEKCGFITTTKALLRKHDEKCHTEGNDDYIKENPFKCSVCDYRAKKIGVIKGHLKKHGLRMCTFCDFTASSSEVDSHMRAEHSDKVTSKLCRTCGRYIKCDSEDFDSHFENCDGKKRPYACKTCGKEYEYASALRMHSFTHDSGPKKFSCEKCNYKTHYKINLQKHMANKHAENREKNVSCPDCDKKFFNEDNLRRHLVSHSEERPFKCEECSKTFKTQVALKGHSETHITDRPYACGIDSCGKSFKSTKLLRLHQDDVHKLLPRKFKCNFEGCDYIFFKSSHLIRHRATHTDERRYICDWADCGKAFRHADNLKVHYRQHTNEKPVKCPLCDFACRQKNSLTWHMKRQHPEIVTDSDNSGSRDSPLFDESEVNNSTSLEMTDFQKEQSDSNVVDKIVSKTVKRPRKYTKKNIKAVKNFPNGEITTNGNDGLLEILGNLQSIEDASFADAEESDIDDEFEKIINILDPSLKNAIIRTKRVYRKRKIKGESETSKGKEGTKNSKKSSENLSESFDWQSKELDGDAKERLTGDVSSDSSNRTSPRRILSPRAPKSPRNGMSNCLVSKSESIKADNLKGSDVYAFTSDNEDNPEANLLNNAVENTKSDVVPNKNDGLISSCILSSSNELEALAETEEYNSSDCKSHAGDSQPLDIAAVHSLNDNNTVQCQNEPTIHPPSDDSSNSLQEINGSLNELKYENCEDIPTEEQIIDSINASDFEKESKELFDSEVKENDEDVNDINIPRCEGEIIDRHLLQKYLEDATMDEFEKEQLIKDTEPKSKSEHYSSNPMMANNDNCPPTDMENLHTMPPPSNHPPSVSANDVDQWEAEEGPKSVPPTSWQSPGTDADKQLTHSVDRLYDNGSLLTNADDDGYKSPGIEKLNESGFNASQPHLDGGVSYRHPELNGPLSNMYESSRAGLLPSSYPLYPGSGYSGQSGSSYLPSSGLLPTSMPQSGSYLDPYHNPQFGHNSAIRQQYENPLGSLAMSTAKFIESEVSKTVERRVYSQQGWALQETQSLRLTHSLFPGAPQNWEAGGIPPSAYPYIDRDVAYNSPASSRTLPDRTLPSGYLSGQSSVNPESLDKPHQASFDRYDMAYLNSRHPTIGQGHSFNQLPTLGGASKALADPYRQEYRSLAHTPTPDLYTSNLDKYFYPRDSMYTAQRVAGLQPENPFLSQPVPPQHQYLPRDYGRSSVYPQANPYELVSDKQYPDPSKYSQSMSSMQGRELFLPHPSSTGAHIQDPYRATMPFYNMMNRSYM